MSKARSKVREAYFNATTFTRPDSSGIRGKGANMKTFSLGSDEYPYDKARLWGEPTQYGKHTAGDHAGSRQNVPIPKNLDGQDDRWTDDITDIDEQTGDDGWMSATPMRGNIIDNPAGYSKFNGEPKQFYDPEEEMDEALGSPSNIAKASSGGSQNSGGRLQPGAGGSWSSRPKGDGWDNVIDDEELEKAGKFRQTEYNYGLPFTGDIIKGRTRTTDTPDEEIPEPKPTATIRFGMTPGRTTQQARHKPGMTTRENRHRNLVEAFLSLKSIPQASKCDTASLYNVDLGFTLDNFQNASDQARGTLDSYDETDVIRFLMGADPDYFMKSLGSIGKDNLINIYDKWTSSVLEKDKESIEKMAERISSAIASMRK